MPTDPGKIRRLKSLLKRGWKKHEIAAEFNVSRQAVWQMIRRYNLDGKTKNESRYYFLRAERRGIKDPVPKETVQGTEPSS